MRGQQTGKRVNPEAPRRESEGGTGGLLDGRHLEENGEEVLSLEVAADAGRDTDAVAVVQPTNGIPGTVSENQQQQQQGQHDRLPDMLESLDRVTKTVNDLKGRCRQLSLGERPSLLYCRCPSVLLDRATGGCLALG